MKEVNFNSLKNIKAPQEWLDKAALIPEAGSRKKRAFPIYRAVAAASLVLVSAIAILLFIFFGDQSPIAVRKKDPHDVFSTEWVSPDNVPDDGFVPHLDTILPTFPRVAPTDAHGQPVTEVIPTEKNSSAPKPTTRVSPSQAATERKANPTQNAVAPTEESPAPTSAPATESPEPTEPSAQSNAPTPQIPTEGNNSAESVFSFFATFDASLLNEGEAVYCIYSPAGYAVGTETAFKKQQADYFITKNGTVFASCDVLIDFPLPAEITAYQYYFVNERGHRLASGTQTV